MRLPLPRRQTAYPSPPPPGTCRRPPSLAPGQDGRRRRDRL